MEIRASGRTDRGLVRAGNEDAFVVDLDVGLFAVLDGMGGHAAGEVAAGTAATALRIAVWQARHTIQAAANTDLDGPALLAGVLRDALRCANGAVWHQATDDPALSGMGCTLTAVLLSGPAAAMANVGDSRLYRLRGRSADQVTTDHTVTAELVRMGLVSPQDARHHPQAHILTRALGTEPAVEADIAPLDITPGDRLILCSDGLADYLADSDHLAALAGGDTTGSSAEATEWQAERLVRHALDCGGRDNVTVVVVDLIGEPVPVSAGVSSGDRPGGRPGAAGG